MSNAEIAPYRSPSRAGASHRPGDGRELVNSSGLRTHLFAFTLALAKRIRDNDGGVSLLLLDDPQTLFDEHNQRRVARALGELPRHGIRSLITTYDRHWHGRQAHRPTAA